MSAKSRPKRLTIYLTQTEMEAFREAAKKCGQTASMFGAQTIMAEVHGDGRSAEPLSKEFFVKVINLSITGNLTPERLKSEAKGGID